MSELFVNLPIRLKQIEPDASENFFRNYINHLKLIKDELITVSDTETHHSDLMLDVLLSHYLNKLDLVDKPIYDRYDLLDEILGAITLPILFLTLSILLTAKACVDLLLDLVNYFFHFSDELFFEIAQHDTGSAIVCLRLSLEALIKSATHMYSRPFLTLKQGYNTSLQPRFYHERLIRNSIEQILENPPNQIVNVFEQFNVNDRLKWVSIAPMMLISSAVILLFKGCMNLLEGKFNSNENRVNEGLRSIHFAGQCLLLATLMFLSPMISAIRTMIGINAPERPLPLLTPPADHPSDYGLVQSGTLI